jgi:hypothetical protein
LIQAKINLFPLTIAYFYINVEQLTIKHDVPIEIEKAKLDVALTSDHHSK